MYTVPSQSLITDQPYNMPAKGEGAADGELLRLIYMHLKENGYQRAANLLKNHVVQKETEEHTTLHQVYTAWIERKRGPGEDGAPARRAEPAGRTAQAGDEIKAETGEAFEQVVGSHAAGRHPPATSEVWRWDSDGEEDAPLQEAGVITRAKPKSACLGKAETSTPTAPARPTSTTGPESAGSASESDSDGLPPAQKSAEIHRACPGRQPAVREGGAGTAKLGLCAALLPETAARDPGGSDAEESAATPKAKSASPAPGEAAVTSDTRAAPSETTESSESDGQSESEDELPPTQVLISQPSAAPEVTDMGEASDGDRGNTDKTLVEPVLLAPGTAASPSTPSPAQPTSSTGGLNTAPAETAGGSSESECEDGLPLTQQAPLQPGALTSNNPAASSSKSTPKASVSGKKEASDSAHSSDGEDKAPGEPLPSKAASAPTLKTSERTSALPKTTAEREAAGSDAESSAESGGGDRAAAGSDAESSAESEGGDRAAADAESSAESGGGDRAAADAESSAESGGGDLAAADAESSAESGGGDRAAADAESSAESGGGDRAAADAESSTESGGGDLAAPQTVAVASEVLPKRTLTGLLKLLKTTKKVRGAPDSSGSREMRLTGSTCAVPTGLEHSRIAKEMPSRVRKRAQPVPGIAIAVKRGCEQAVHSPEKRGRQRTRRGKTSLLSVPGAGPAIGKDISLGNSASKHSQPSEVAPPAEREAVSAAETSTREGKRKGRVDKMDSPAKKIKKRPRCPESKPEGRGKGAGSDRSRDVEKQNETLVLALSDSDASREDPLASVNTAPTILTLPLKRRRKRRRRRRKGKVEDVENGMGEGPQEKEMATPGQAERGYTSEANQEQGKVSRKEARKSSSPERALFALSAPGRSSKKRKKSAKGVSWNPGPENETSVLKKVKKDEGKRAEAERKRAEIAGRCEPVAPAGRALLRVKNRRKSRMKLRSKRQKKMKVTPYTLLLDTLSPKMYSPEAD